jgi:uncharacterized protein YlxW (UPF0749 family)
MSTDHSADRSGPVRPAGPGPLTTALLDDLLNNTLDPGYRAAAGSARHRWHRSAAWIGCVLIGLILVLAYQQSHRSAPARETARKELISRIRTLQQAGDRIQQQSKALAQQVSELREANVAGGRDSALAALEAASGSIAVTGPGLVVDLAEPDSVPTAADGGRAGTIPQCSVGFICDTQLRAVVNRLWSSGAEAIAVNGVRLTPTAAIRFAGQSILVDLQPITSPYSVEAIGDAESLQTQFADSAEARALSTLKGVDGISFSLHTESKLQLPAGTVSQPRQAAKGAASPAPKSPSASPR